MQGDYFLYEFVTGGGLYAWREPPGGPLLAEGLAMLRAVCEDFQRANCRPRLLWDARLPIPPPAGADVARIETAQQERREFLRHSREAAAALVIAPELQGALLERCRWVEEAGGRLLSPDSRFVELAADKWKTLMLWRQDAPRPGGLCGPQPPPPAAYPLIVKPRDGAGSHEVLRVDSPRQWPTFGEERMWEPFYPGEAVSAAVLCSRRKRIALPACRQHLETGGFQYLGGETPLPLERDRRARAAALAALRNFPPTQGYVGVDLVLGENPDGSEDVAIEVNPRLTTSYIGLRQALEGNFSQAMMQAAEDRLQPLDFHPRRIAFQAT